MSSQIKRKPSSLDEKIEILNDFNTNKLTVTQLVKKYNRPQSTVSSVLKAENQEKIKNLYENNLIQPSSKRMRGSNFVKIEEALDHWFKLVMSYKNITLNGPLIQAQAIKYATMLNQPDFKARNGWLDGFKKRQNITFKTIVGEAGLVDPTTIKNWLKILPDLIKGYTSNNIFNADETALFYKALPDKTMYISGLPCNSDKQLKQRLSLLLGSNWDGSEKLKPIVIGSSKTPRCFKNINKANLPVYYRNNPKAWINAVIFKEWLVKLDKKFKLENRHILLFLDNFSGHHDTKDTKEIILTNIKIHYFPANCTSVVQPMDQGIIQSIKIKYGDLIVMEKLNYIEAGAEMPEIDVLNSINKINKAWTDVKQEDVENSDWIEYEKSFDKLNKVTNSFDFNKFAYANIDKDLEPFGQLSDEEIINAINEEEDDEQLEIEQQIEPIETVVQISKKEATDCIDKLRLFFAQRNEDCSLFIDQLSKMDQFCSKDQTIQSKIDKYFS
ncbi:unnamed protein product [Brachionus calyciflorus]|uniref:HTH CENPB-type domain-containing protein n=1 Tax=Brachionus calyciflorus TaxID=104777 RepID=A0A813ZRS5_9BILA|nr:unnamed protein product [Brachionus calyciflorus]